MFTYSCWLCMCIYRFISSLLPFLRLRCRCVKDVCIASGLCFCRFFLRRPMSYEYRVSIFHTHDSPPGRVTTGTCEPSFVEQLRKVTWAAPRPVFHSSGSSRMMSCLPACLSCLCFLRLFRLLTVSSSLLSAGLVPFFRSLALSVLPSSHLVLSLIGFLFLCVPSAFADDFAFACISSQTVGFPSFRISLLFLLLPIWPSPHLPYVSLFSISSSLLPFHSPFSPCLSLFPHLPSLFFSSVFPYPFLRTSFVWVSFSLLSLFPSL